MIASIKVSECWLGTFSCVLTQCQEGETSAVILEHLLLHNSLEAVIRPFSNNLNSTVRKIIHK